MEEELLFIIFELSKLSNDVKMASQKSLIFEVGILKLCIGNKGYISNQKSISVDNVETAKPTIEKNVEKKR